MLTDKAIKNAKPRSKSYKLFDGNGLFLEIMPNESKLWRLKYRYFGKEKRISLGHYPLVSLAEAREKRDEAKKLLLRDIDPSVAKHDRRREIVRNTQGVLRCFMDSRCSLSRANTCRESGTICSRFIFSLLF